MPVKKDANGQRYVEAEVEVPGSPEDVWRAIATGKGISSWFVPCTVEERVGGTAVSSFGPGMDSVATIKTWDPPKSFSFDTQEEPGNVATEWIVEPRAGGTCVVRVVHRWFASTDQWDAQFDGHTYGWAAFFRILKLYLAHYAGQKCSAFQLAAFSPVPAPETWRTVMSGLKIDEKARRATSTPGTPELSGAVESVGPEAYPELLLRLDRPAPGLAHLFVMPCAARSWFAFASTSMAIKASPPRRRRSRRGTVGLPNDSPRRCLNDGHCPSHRGCHRGRNRGGDHAGCHSRTSQRDRPPRSR